MLMGGDGVISVTANVAPAAMHELARLARAGNREAARALDAKLLGLHQSLSWRQTRFRSSGLSNGWPY